MLRAFRCPLLRSPGNSLEELVGRMLWDISFYELLAVEYSWVFASSGNTSVWHVTRFLLLLLLKLIAFEGSWDYYWCFEWAGVKVGFTLASGRWFEDLGPGDIYANRKNAFFFSSGQVLKDYTSFVDCKWKNKRTDIGLGGKEKKEERVPSLRQTDKGRVVSLPTALWSTCGMGNSECLYNWSNEWIVAFNSTGS